MNATAIEAIDRLKAILESEDNYSRGFNDGYAAGKAAAGRDQG
jgi:hypothetical protein